MAALSLAAVMLLTGCEENPSNSGPAGWPAGAEGLACNYVEYEQVAETLGVRFDTAGGARKDDTHTCALTQSGREFPDLTFSIAATTANEVIFQPPWRRAARRSSRAWAGSPTGCRCRLLAREDRGSSWAGSPPVIDS
jgi:hypothetical protein